jgi:deoxycytidylate deaminase
VVGKTHDRDFDQEIICYTGPTAGPPTFAVRQAEAVALRSPCANAKVGVAIYRCHDQLADDQELAIETVAEGYNSPPLSTPHAGDLFPSIRCDGSDACRRDCAKRCVHAEPRALRAIPDQQIVRTDLLRLVHVRLGPDGHAHAVDGPSCVECSKAIQDAGIGGIWLYERRVEALVAWDTWWGQGTQGTPNPSMPRWRYYTAIDFHRETCLRLGIYQVTP